MIDETHLRKIEKIIYALRAMRVLKEIGEGHDRIFFEYQFENDPIRVSIADGNKYSCTCKDCSLTSQFRCCYVLGVQFYRVFPEFCREELIKALLQEALNVKKKVMLCLDPYVLNER